MTLRPIATLAAVIVLTTPARTDAQVAPDPGLLSEINAIKAIDNHGHPQPVLGDGEVDTEFGPVPETIPPEVLPVRLRGNNPEYVQAWKELYAYPHADASPAHLRDLATARRRVMQEKGAGYPSWVLDQLGIESMNANRWTLGSGLTAPRFRWVWHANPLLFPLDNSRGKRSNPQRETDFTTEERLLKSALEELRLPDLPETLDAYLAQVVVPLLERRKNGGAVAVKIYAAYLRSLDFADAPEEEARSVYAAYRRSGIPGEREYKALQDFLFRRIAIECRRLGLAVHVHVGAGAGDWFYNSGASPFLLDSVLNDPKMAGTTFVLIHGGLPLAQATRMLLNKPNVYADFSSQAFLTSDRELSQVLRSWLEFVPERVLFGTDAYPLTTSVGWEAIGWLTTRSARRALALALTGMMQDAQITRERASELARMVLRDNARALYSATAR